LKTAFLSVAFVILYAFGGLYVFVLLPVYVLGILYVFIPLPVYVLGILYVFVLLPVYVLIPPGEQKDDPAMLIKPTGQLRHCEIPPVPYVLLPHC
jgi:hypothetical protein